MIQVVIFADSSLQDNEEVFESKDKFGDIIFELPTKSAGPYRIATETRKQGYTCQIVNLCFYFTVEEIQELCRKFINSNTLIVGLSTTFWFHNSAHGEHRRAVIKEIINFTKNLKTPKLVFGGTLSTYYSEKISADASFSGFAEGKFIQYLNAIAYNSELPKADRYSSKNNPEYDPDKVSDFDFNSSQIIYDPSDCVDYGESKVIETARGCIFRCDFCAYPLNGKKKLDYIKNDDVFREELIRNYEQYGIQNYTLSDDTFNDSTIKLERIHKITNSLPFKIRFIGYVRLDLIHAHREQIQLLKELGLVGVFFGVETFNHNSGKAIGKGLDPEKQKELLYDLKSKHWGNDVNITLGMISGLPFETMKSHKETIDWILNEKECLVDRIRPAPLGIPNPLIDKYPFKSKFQINAAKLGYYWPNKDSHNWKTLGHEVKTFDQAVNMSQEIYHAAASRHLVHKGNFSLPLVSNIAKYNKDPKTFDDLLYMDKIEYSKWYIENRQHMITAYVNEYKRKIMNL
jgi:radical SAM superfamily enzyme YgiQ (UPF0313 family)